MGDSDAADVWTRSNRALYELLAPASPGALIVNVGEGARAAVTPAAPHHAPLNAVHPVSGAALESAFGAARELYAKVGVEAWMVWVAPGDDDLTRTCERLGGSVRATPELMHASLGAIDVEPRGTVEVEPEATLDDVMVINDVARDRDHGLSGVFTARPGTALRWIVGRLDGVRAGSACWAVIGGDAYVGFVATLPQMRGRGVASELVRIALSDAVRAGARTSTLEDTTAGTSLFAALGYRERGQCGMYEWRRTPGS